MYSRADIFRRVFRTRTDRVGRRILEYFHLVARRKVFRKRRGASVDRSESQRASAIFYAPDNRERHLIARALERRSTFVAWKVSNASEDAKRAAIKSYGHIIKQRNKVRDNVASAAIQDTSKSPETLVLILFSLCVKIIGIAIDKRHVAVHDVHLRDAESRGH